MTTRAVYFIAVHYHQVEKTIAFVRSIQDIQVDPGITKKIVIVNNGSSDGDLETFESLEDEVRDQTAFTVVGNQDNVGYFRGLNVGIHAVEGTPDWAYVGNNDITFPRDFCKQVGISIGRSVPAASVICPAIIDNSGVNQNPHLPTRPGLRRRLLNKVYFSNFRVAEALLRVKKLVPSPRRHPTAHDEASSWIYAGFGAGYILSNTFFERYRGLPSLLFLWGEEVALAEMLYLHGEAMLYAPNVVIRHHEHSSTGAMPSRRYYEIARESHRLLEHIV